MAALSREEFHDQVVQIISARFPLMKIEPGDGSFSLSINGAVAPLENLYRGAVHFEDPADITHYVERWAVELLRAAEGLPDQAATYEEVKDRILPMLVRTSALAKDDDDETGEGDDEEEIPGATTVPATSTGSGGSSSAAGGAIVSQPLLDGLQIAYAIDHDRTIAYISRSRFEKWGITIDQLHETAIENLTARSEAIAAHAGTDENGQVNLILFETRDGYDASRILLPTLHDRLREHLGSPFAAAIPNRDILLCFRNESDMLDRLREQIGEDYRSMPHQVTDKLFLVTPDGIAPLS
jgi:uncharacterized protein YtpQ (UPF0354 family)